MVEWMGGVRERSNIKYIKYLVRVESTIGLTMQVWTIRGMEWGSFD